jgi:hypothetical protein
MLPQPRVRALVRELHRVVRFDYIGVSIRDEKSNTLHRHFIDAKTEAAIPPGPELATIVSEFATTPLSECAAHERPFYV